MSLCALRCLRNLSIVSYIKHMKTSELHYDYPAHLVATEKDPVSRVMMVKNEKPHGDLPF